MLAVVEAEVVTHLILLALPVVLVVAAQVADHQQADQTPLLTQVVAVVVVAQMQRLAAMVLAALLS